MSNFAINRKLAKTLVLCEEFRVTCVSLCILKIQFYGNYHWSYGTSKVTLKINENRKSRLTESVVAYSLRLADTDYQADGLIPIY